MLSAQEIATRSTDWVLLVLVLIAVLVVLAKLAQTDRTNFFLLLPFRVQANEWAANFNPIQSKKLSDSLLSLSAILTLALAALLIKRFWLGEQSLGQDFLPYLKIVFTLIIIFLGKTLLGSLIAAVFDVQARVTAVQNINFAYFSWMLLPLYPLVVGCIFLSWEPTVFAKALIVLCALGIILTLWNTARAALQIGVYLSYNIFYLCALEIVPVMFLVLLLQKI